MQSSVNRKKTSDTYNQLLHSLHFAVCPYAIDLSSKMDSIFTLNFQKDRQIVGQLSTMIYPQLDRSHIELDALKNLMIFRVFKDVKSDYKWVLYERNQNGKQQMTQTVKVNLSEQTDKLIAQLRSLTSSKHKLHDSKSLNNSSKIYDSIHSVKTSQKGLQLKKSPIILNTNSSVSTNQINEIKSAMKQMKSKFLRSLIEVSYIFCIGFSEDQIIQTIKNFHLESKFNIVSKTLKKADQLIGPQIRMHSPLNNLELIEEQLQFSRQMLKKNSSIDQSIKEPSGNNLVSGNILLGKFALTQPQKIDQQINYPDSIPKSTSQQVILTSKNNDKPLQIANPSQVVLKEKQKNFSQLTNRQKTSIHQLDSLDFPQNNPQNQTNADLSKTQKSQKHILFNLDHAQNRQLVQTTPSNTIHDKNASKLAPKSITYTDQSNLKLDDVILNGKRISVSDKSQWMITSKSKTSDYDKTEQSNPTHKLNPKNKNQTKDFQSSNNLQINSRNQEEMSLDLISAKPKQKHSENQDVLTVQMDKVEKDQKRQDKHENMVKQNSILVIDNCFKLKRKSTAQDFQSNQNRIELTNKPKTMEDSTIRKELNTIKGKLRQGNWIDENEQPQEQQISTPMFKNSRNKEEKFKNLIPSMIDETAQIKRQGSMSKSNSGQDPDPFNPNLDDNYDWGQGLSEIRLQQTHQQEQFMGINASLDRLCNVSKHYSEKYVKPIHEKLRQYPHFSRAQRFLTERFNLKHFIFIIFIVAIILLSWVSGQLYSSSESSLSGISKIKKAKKRKQPRRKR